jgi:hypothetical protein
MSEQQTWRKRNKFKIQAGALAAIVAGSLALHPALSASAGLAVVCFGVVAVAMAITVWVS